MQTNSRLPLAGQRIATATLSKGVSFVDGLLVLDGRVMTLDNRVMRLANGG